MSAGLPSSILPPACLTEWACTEQLNLWMFWLHIFPSGYKYEGVKFERGNCGVSIMRSGELNLSRLTYQIRVFSFVSACIMSSVHMWFVPAALVLHILLCTYSSGQAIVCSGLLFISSYFHFLSLSVKLIDRMNTKWCKRIMLHGTLRQTQCHTQSAQSEHL